jgi:hypothetical protein
MLILSIGKVYFLNFNLMTRVRRRVGGRQRRAPTELGVRSCRGEAFGRQLFTFITKLLPKFFALTSDIAPA